MMIIKIIYFTLITLYINNCFAINAEKLLSPLPLNNLIHISDKVKPNIIALIDNSNFTSKTELTILMDAILSDKDIIDSQNWGIAYLYNQKEPFFNIDISLSSTPNITIKIAGMILNTVIPPIPVIGNLTSDIKIPINSQLSTKEVGVNELSKKSHLDKIKSSIKKYHPLGSTSITKKYYNLTKEIRDGNKKTTFGSTIQYPCQTNYIAILTNGINYNSLKTNSILEFINGFSKSNNTEFEDNSSLLRDIINYNPNISSIPNIISILTSIIKLIPEINTGKIVINDDDFVKKYIFNSNGQYIDFEKWNNNENQYGSYGLAFLSENHSNNDIATQYSDYNKKYIQLDNNIFLPKQTIDTIIIGINTSESKDNSYLENGASYIYGFGNRAFFKVLDIKQFKNSINTPFFPSNQKKYLVSNPLMINLNNKRLAIIAEENPINWSTILYFKELNKNNMSFNLDKFYNNSYTTEFGNLTNNLFSNGSSRRFIVSTGKSEPKFLDNETYYNNWLMRISNKSDKDLMLRNRCLEKNCEISYPQRMIGDIGNNNILYIEDKTKKNSSFIVTAANDGMIHIFRNLSNNKFQLILNYIPGSLLKNSQPLWDIIPITAKKNYGTSPNNTHQFLLNGAMSYYGITKKYCSFNNICSKSPAELIIIGSAGKGAKGVYALNIAGKDFNNNNELGLSNESQKAWLKDIPLWESSSKYFGYNKNDPSNYQESLKLGFVIGSPKIAPITIKRYLDKKQYKPDLKSGKYYATFVNNGIFNEDSIPTLYIFDAIGIKSTEIINNDGYIYITNEKKINNAGKIIKKIKVPNDIKFSDRQGLSPVTLVDIDNDEIADIAYAGDYEGNMYRFDFRKSNIDDWSVTRIYKGAGLDENLIPIQPITTAPTVYKKDESGHHYVVIFGTGSNLFLDDIKELYEKYNNKKYPNEKFQSIYGIYDDLNQKNNTEYSKRYQQLVEQKIILSSNKTLNNNNNRKLENNAINDDKKGWFIDLNQQTYNNNESYSEEKIINDPKVFGKSVYFTTEFYKILNSNQECSQYVSKSYGGWVMVVNAINGGNLSDNTINFNTKNPNEKISGIMLDEKISPISFINNKENSNLNKDGQFQNGWEEDSLIPSKKYDEGSLFIYDNNNLILLSNKKNNYIKYRRISWREIF